MSQNAQNEEGNRALITLGGGCFWCLEAVFDMLEGVQDVVSGYAGGHVVRPSYKQVCSGNTGHAEVVQVAFDPAELSFKELLELFFTIHDPTTLNRQGADVGSQYRSAIFFHDDQQRQVAEALIVELDQAGIWANPIVTEVTPLDVFYPAEDYHQEYYAENPDQAYCRVVIEPKVVKFRQRFAHRLKPQS